MTLYYFLTFYPNFNRTFLRTNVMMMTPLRLCYEYVANVCRANSFKRSILRVEFNKSHVLLTNDVQFSKSTSDFLKTTGTFSNG